MDSLSGIQWFATRTDFPFTSTRQFLLCPSTISPIRRRLQYLPQRIPSVLSVLRTPRPVNELVEDEVLRTFFEERELNGDFIAKVSDKIWLRKLIKYVDEEMGMLADATPLQEEASSNEDEGGFLKLKSTYEWVVGDNSAPVNKKLTAKELRDDSKRRRRLNLLRYEALKREMLLLTVGIGALCSGYCLVALSFQAALSYAAGVLFSCLYLQLLYQHADNLTKEMVPQIFMPKTRKKYLQKLCSFRARLYHSFFGTRSHLFGIIESFESIWQ